MLRAAWIASVVLAAQAAAAGEPACILDIDEVPPEGATLVWSPLSQALWDKLNEMQGGRLEKVDPPNALIAKLHEFEWRPDEVMPKNGFAVHVGPATREFGLTTAASIRKQFGVEINAADVPVRDQGLAAYGILLRDLKFKKKFHRSKQAPLEFRSRTGEVHTVEFFGTAGGLSGDYGDLVRVLHCQGDGSSFTLSIATDREGENLIIHRPKAECTFRQAMEGVKNAMKDPLSGEHGSLKDGSLHAQDVIKIPYVTIDAKTDLAPQLKGNLHYAGEAVTWNVGKALQMTRFELSEEAVRVRVDSSMDIGPFGGPPEPPPVIPRKFVCDRPFFVFLWRTEADWPCLATWIDGGTGLTPFRK